MSEDHLSSIIILKDTGNVHFRKGEYDAAVAAYTRAVDECVRVLRQGAGRDGGGDGASGAAEETAVLNKLQETHATLLCNRAACLLKLFAAAQKDSKVDTAHDLATHARADADAALDLKPGYVKARFRLGLACEAVSDALRMGQRTLKLEKSRNGAVATQVAVKKNATAAASHKDIFGFLERALTELSRVVRLEPKNAAAVTAAQRVREKVQRQRAYLSAPGAFIENLRKYSEAARAAAAAAFESGKGDDSSRSLANMAAACQKQPIRDTISDIHSAMGLYLKLTPEGQSQVHREGFPSILLDMLLVPRIELSANGDEAGSALRLKRLVAMSLRTLYVQASRHQATCAIEVDLLGLVGSKLTDAEVKQRAAQIVALLAPKVLSAISGADELEVHKGVFSAIAQIAAHPAFAKHRKNMIALFLEQIDRVKVSGPLSDGEVAHVVSALNALALVANADASALTLVRKAALSALLYSPVAQHPPFRRQITATLSIVLGHMKEQRQKEKDGQGDMYDKMNKKERKAAMDADEMRENVFRQSVAKFIVIPLLSSNDAEKQRRAARALSLVLHAAPTLGVQIVTHNRAQSMLPDRNKDNIQVMAQKAKDSADADYRIRKGVLQKKAEEEDKAKAMAEQAKKDEKVSEEKADAKKKEATQEEKKAAAEQVLSAMRKAMPKTAAAAVEAEPRVTVEDEKVEQGGRSATSAGDQKKEEAPGLPPPLEQLIMMADSPDDSVRLLAAEVLALSSSDLLVRTAVSQNEMDDIFFDLLAKTTAKEKKKKKTKKKKGMLEGEAKSLSEVDYASDLIKCHAGLALSKLGAVGEQQYSDAQQVLLVESLIDTLSTRVEKGQAEMKFSGSMGAAARQRKDQFSDVLLNVVEALAYLSMNVRTKKLFVEREGWLDAIFALVRDGSHDDSMESHKTLLYGIAQIVRNMTTSKEDLERDYNKEIDELRKIAQRGVPGAKEQQSQKQRTTERAGTATTIKNIRIKLAQCHVVSALWSAVKRFNPETSTSQVNRAPKKRDKNDKWGYRRPKEEDVVKVSDPDTGCGKPSPATAEAMGLTLLYLATEPENRGIIVQEGGMKMLCFLHSHYQKARDNCALAMARVAITTNPRLLDPFSLVRPVSALLKKAEHELIMFECLLALTNFASMGPDVCDKMNRDKLWPELRVMLASENEMVQRAAIECMTNLCMCDTGMRRLNSKAGDQDIVFFVVFAGSQDLKTQLAATGALAMISQDAIVARKIARCQVTYRPGRDEDGPSKDCMEERTRNGYMGLVSVAADPKCDAGVLMRLKVLFKNVTEKVGKPGSDKDKEMDALQAKIEEHIAKEDLDRRKKEDGEEDTSVDDTTGNSSRSSGGGGQVAVTSTAAASGADPVEVAGATSVMADEVAAGAPTAMKTEETAQ